MTQRQFIFSLCVLLTIIVLSSIGAYIGIQSNKADTQQNLQTEIIKQKILSDAEIEKQKIINETKLKRTQERMELIPWYNKNKVK